MTSQKNLISALGGKNALCAPAAEGEPGQLMVFDTVVQLMSEDPQIIAREFFSSSQ